MKVGDRYFLLVRPLRHIDGFIAYESSNDSKTWVEYEVIEDFYRLSDNYKIELQPLTKGYPDKVFYYSDFISEVVKERNVIKKTNDDQHVMMITWGEPITNGAYLVHTAPFVVSDTPLVTWIYGI